MPKILDGKKVAQKLKDRLKIDIENIKSKFDCVPGLAVVQVGNVAASSAVSYTHLTLPTMYTV